MGKLRVKILDSNQTVIKQGKYKISETGNQVILKKGSKGRGNSSETAPFTHVNIIKEPQTGIINTLKFWKPKILQYGFLKNKKFINFATLEIPSLDETAINESTEKRLLTRLGEEPKDTPIIQWIGVALSAMILLFLVMG